MTDGTPLRCYNVMGQTCVLGREAMVSEETRAVIAQAKQIYEERLKESLEADHADQFVAIEPDFGDFFIADTFDEAVRPARSKHPAKISHTIRVGHPAAFQIGGLSG